MNIKCYRCPNNDTLEIVVKEIAQYTYEMSLFKVYGSIYDEEGEAYDELVVAKIVAEKAPETFDEAALLMLNDIGLEIDRLRFELKKEKTKCHRCDLYKNDLPF